MIVYRLQETVYLIRITANLPDDCSISFCELRGLLFQEPPEAFTFHETCWTDFVRLFAPGKLSLNALIEVCRVIPYSEALQRPLKASCHIQESWDNYSRLWRDWKLVERQSAVFNLAVHPTLRGDKYELGMFDRRLRSIRLPEKQWDRDVFQELTFDIIISIASFLPVEDIIKFCSVSKATYAAKSVFECQSFWKSRFFVDGEQGYLNWLLDKEVKLFSGTAFNWKRLFFRAKLVSRDPEATRKINFVQNYRYNCYYNALKSEEERWRRLRWFSDRCKMVRSPRSTHSLPLDYSTKSLDWQKVMCEYLCDTNTCLGNWSRRGRCLENWSKRGQCIKDRHSTFNRTIVVHPSLYRISFSILDEGDKTYISGMEFMFKDPKVLHGIIGYTIPGKETTMEVDPSEALRGFEISYSERGIEAVRLLTYSTGKRPSRLLSPRWMGKRRSRDATKTRLVSNSEMVVIEGKFNVSIDLCNLSVMK